MLLRRSSGNLFTVNHGVPRQTAIRTGQLKSLEVVEFASAPKQSGIVSQNHLSAANHTQAGESRRKLRGVKNSKIDR
jgi:hypothetical protein